MRIYRYWVKHSKQLEVTAKLQESTIINSSNTSINEAVSDTERQLLISQKRINSEVIDDPGYETNISKGIIDTIDPNNIITRNRYGALVLNSKFILFLICFCSSIAMSQIEDTKFNRIQYNFERPSSNEYLVLFSAIPNKHKKGYYQNKNLFSNSVKFGLTENITLAGGIMDISSLFFAQVSWGLTPKIGISVNNYLHIGIGAFVQGINLRVTNALGLGLITIGSSNHNLTITGGFGLFNNELTPIPAIAVSGTTRLNNYLALTSENFIIPNQNSTLNYYGGHGLRVLTKKNAFDLGIFYLGYSEFFSSPLFAPVIGYTRTFESKK